MDRLEIIVSDEGSVPKLNLDCKETRYESFNRLVEWFSANSPSPSEIKKMYIAAMDKLKASERLSVLLNFE